MAKNTLVIDENYLETIKELTHVLSVIDTLKEAEAKCKEKLKDYAVNEWVALYEQTNSNPKAVEFLYSANKKTGGFTLTPKESGAKLDSITATSLAKKYGTNVLKKEVSYKINNTFFEENFDTIMSLLKKNEDSLKLGKLNSIDDVIKVEDTYKLNKTIDAMGSFKQNKDINFKTMFLDFNTIFSMGEVNYEEK